MTTMPYLGTIVSAVITDCHLKQAAAAQAARVQQEAAQPPSAPVTPQPSNEGSPMTAMPNLGTIISAAIADHMTPEFIETHVKARAEKIVIEAIDQSLKSYSDTRKIIDAAIKDALKVDKLDLPSYGSTIATILQAQITAITADLVAGKLAEDMAEILNIAPKHLKLSEIAEIIRKENRSEGKGFTCRVIETEYGSTLIYLDEQECYSERETKQCQVEIHIHQSRILTARFDGRDAKTMKVIGRSFGLDQMVRAWFACGTTIELDGDDFSCDAVDY